MSFDARRLYELLPAIYRVRDAEQGLPLEAVLSVIAEQVAAVEENLQQLYDDQFIETCAEWVVPYIGDLVGARGLYDLRGAVSQRAQVANTLTYRRRKGTAAVLEQVARDVTGWNARAVEFFRLLATTQHTNHVRRDAASTPDLRRTDAVGLANTAFDALPRTAEVRRAASRRGRHNIPNVGIFLWRLGAYSLTRSPAFKLEAGDDDRRYRFGPLGNDAPLYVLPETEALISQLAGPANVPVPLDRRTLDQDLGTYYGRSLTLFEGEEEVPAQEVTACDLSEWVRRPQTKYAVDPELGRISSPQDRAAPTDLRVSYHYGFAAEMGGGEYGRDLLPIPADRLVETVPPKALREAIAEISSGGTVEITDSGRYGGTLAVRVSAEDGRVEVRARDGSRPNVELGGVLEISGAENTSVTLDGLLVSGAALRVPARVVDPSSGNDEPRRNGLRRLCLRHCTLVPGLGLGEDGTPRSPAEPSLVVEAANVEVEIDHSIVGGIRVTADSRVRISNSIVDATESPRPSAVNLNAADAAGLTRLPLVGPSMAAAILEHRRSRGFFRSVDELEAVPGIGSATLEKIKPFATVDSSESRVAYAAMDGEGPGGTLSVENSTLIGKVHTGLMELASNTIFRAFLAAGDAWEAPIRCGRLQRGCVRFSFVPPGSRVPRRHRCRPQDEAEAVRVRPRFTSLRFGDPGYCQLDPSCAGEILRGADDAAEMGAFHDLFAPQRETNLRVRLEEYLRFGIEAGVFYES